jgi:signal peptidase complex subunit 2
MAKKKSKNTTPATETEKNSPLDSIDISSHKDRQDNRKNQNATQHKNDAANANADNSDDLLLEDEELELLQVDLGDMVKLKQVLDEAVAAAILELQPEDYRWDNFKLVIMFTACLFACMAQFAPLPFPESRPVLGVCGTAYFVLSGVLQLITTFIDKDSILLTLPLPEADGKAVKNKDMLQTGLRVRSALPRFSEWYSVTIEFQLPEHEIGNRLVHQRWSVGQFFDKEGYFDETGFMQHATELYHTFAAGKYNSVAVDEKKTQ